MQVRAELAFRRDGRHHVAQRLAAHDALTGLHECAGQPRIGADRAIRLANGHVPAPEIIPHAGEHHAVAHADGGFAARCAQIDGGMRLPAVKRRPKHGLRGEAAKQPAGNGANRARNGRKADGRERRQRRRAGGRRGGRGGDLRRGGGGLHVFRLTETVGIQRRADDDSDHRAERHPIGVIQQPFPRLTQTVFEKIKHGHPSLLKEG